MIQYLKQSIECLKTKRRQMCWSIHKTDKSMDKAGKATDYNFHVMSHNELIEFLLLFHSVATTSARQSVLLGNACSQYLWVAHSVHNLQIYIVYGPFTWLRHARDSGGTLSTSSEGYPMWCHPSGRTLALAQFRDNIVIACRGPRTTQAVRDVCGTLTNIWKLPVLCPCMKNPGDPCKEKCMTQELRAPGICMHRAGGRGTCVAHPSAFDENWSLKLGPPLQSAWAVQDVALANLSTSVLVNALPFIRSWGCVLLSAATCYLDFSRITRKAYRSRYSTCCSSCTHKSCCPDPICCYPNQTVYSIYNASFAC